MRYGQYKKFPDAQLNLRLLWEYDAAQIDFDSMRDIIIQRVVQRGWPQDWYFILNRYGLKNVKAAISNMTGLTDNQKDFVRREFNIHFFHTSTPSSPKKVL